MHLRNLCHNLNGCCVFSWQDFKCSIQDLEKPESSEEQEKDEKSESADEEEKHEERPNKDEGDGALHDSAFAIARAATGMDRRGNGHSSITSDQGNEREGCRAAGPLELRKEPRRSRASRDVVFTTLHLLPRSEGEQYKPTASTLPRLLIGQQAHCRVLAEAQLVSVSVVITKNKSKWSSLSLLCFP